MWMDAFQVGLFIGLITAWSYRALTNILLADEIREAKRHRRARTYYVAVPERERPPVTADDARRAQRAADRAQKPRQRRHKASTPLYR